MITILRKLDGAAVDTSGSSVIGAHASAFPICLTLVALHYSSSNPKSVMRKLAIGRMAFDKREEG